MTIVDEFADECLVTYLILSKCVIEILPRLISMHGAALFEIGQRPEFISETILG